MVTLTIAGIRVEFPFPPYESQLIYMEKVITALMAKQNAILESPTGTGKTLCLLCATLAWRRHIAATVQAMPKPTASQALAYEGSHSDEEAQGIDERIPRIIYSSRTHSQLKQVVQELKNTSYRPSVAVLGSREYLCVDEKVSQMRGTRQNLGCRRATKGKKCAFKRGFDALMKARSKKINLPIMDIEELVVAMKEQTVCPFFLSRAALPESEIVFVPYNYLVDPMARKAIGISIENAVLIFDEAHNVESVASEAASYALSSNEIAGCVAEVQQLIQQINENRVVLPAGSSLSVESVETLKALLLEIDKGLNAFPLGPTGGYTKSGEYIFEFFQQFNVNFETCPLVLNMIEEIIDLQNERNQQKTTTSRLDGILSFLGTIFRDKASHMTVAKNYRVHIQEESDRAPKNAPRLFNSVRNAKTTRVFNYWCFHPGVSFQEICKNNIYNMILTSGTLSPLETTIKELGVDFPVRLENCHVIDSNQIWVGVVGTGVTGKRLNSSYNFRSTDEYLLELGNTIVNFARLVPNGLLVFFPSYGILEDCVKRWRRPADKPSSSASVWDRLMGLKELFVEPRARVEFKTVVDEYHETIKNNPQGAIFFAVCRGKVSEGIDFANEKGRAVVITGLPFPPTKDPKIVLKKSILDEAIVPLGEAKLTGNSWYVQQASRAVNQAIGRVIRHRHDYGAIILCDERFNQQQQQTCLSKWLKPYCRSYRTYGEAHVGLLRFFKENQAKSTAKLTGPSSADGKAQTSGLPSDRATADDAVMTSSSSASSISTAIGDGQSYINPVLFRKAAIAQPANSTPPGDSNRTAVITKSSNAPAKRTLGSLLAISSRSRMVGSTSSISRPFQPPKIQAPNDVRAREVEPSPFATDSSGRNERADGQTPAEAAAAFPVIARSLLGEDEVKQLYGMIRRLRDDDEDAVEAVLKDMCELLRDPQRQELLDLMPRVLGSPANSIFVTMATSLGLHFTSSGALGQRPDSTTMLFDRLQQTKRRKHNAEPPAAVIEDPQCFVCYEISRKAYASQCGHICCLSCWQKMESDGFTECPVCKAPFKLNELRLIRAARKNPSDAAKPAQVHMR